MHKSLCLLQLLLFVSLYLGARTICTTTICLDGQTFDLELPTDDNPTAFASMIMDCTENSAPFCLGETSGLLDQVTCVPITAQNYVGVAGFQFTVEFDTSIIDFDAVNFPTGSPVSDPASFNIDFATEGTVGVLFFADDPAAFDLDDGTVLFELCFEGLNNGVSALNVTSSLVPIYISDAEGEALPFTGGDGEIEIVSCFDSETTIDTTICDGETVVIGGTVFTAEGEYPITLVTPDGCDSLINLVLQISEVGFQLPPLVEVCEGEQATLSVPAGFLLGLNNNPQGNTIILDPGDTYEITVLDDASGCSEVQMVTVEAQPFPEVTIEGDQEVCPGQTATILINGQDSYAYSWSNGIAEPLNILPAGEYDLTITDTSSMAACAIVRTITIVEFDAPVITIEGEVGLCVGGETVLTAFGGLNYEWSTGEAVESIVVTMAGEYCVTGTDANGCSLVTCVVVEELPLPEVVIGGELSFCAGSETELTASGAATYAWTTGATTASIIVEAPGEYCVTGTDANGCSFETCVVVEELPLPEVVIGGELSFCAGSETELTASGAATYAWTTGATTASIVVEAPGEYCVTGTDANGCSRTTCVQIEPDTTPPAVVYCPPNVEIIVNQGQMGGFASWQLPLIEDDCGAASLTITSTHQPGDFFPVGETTVVYTASDASGNEAFCEFLVTVNESDDLTFYIDTVDYTVVNDTFCIPVRTLNFTDVAAFQFTLEAPNTLFSTIVDVDPAPTFSMMGAVGGIVYDAENMNAGRVLWLDASSDGITVPDSSVVFTVKMLITADFGECVPLDITSSLLAIEAFIIPDEEVRPTVYGGDICVNNLIDIVGEIFKIDDNPIRNAEVTLSTMDSTWIDSTDVAGRYEFLEVIGGENYNIRPTRDFDHDEGLSVSDMVVILRDIQGRAAIEDPYLRVAADVNRTMTITVADVLEIRELVLGNLTTFTDNQSWRFIPTTYMFPDPMNPWLEVFPESVDLAAPDTSRTVDFYGVKTGDVNLTAVGQLWQSSPLVLQLAEQQYQPGQYIDVPIYVEDWMDIAGFQAGLKFDQEALTLDQVLPGDVADFNPESSIGLAQAEEGKIKLLYYRANQSSSATTVGQHLCTLRFAVHRAGRLSEAIGLHHSVLRVLAVTDELVEIPVDLTWTSLTDLLTIADEGPALELIAARPNPFQQSLTIHYQVTKTQDAQIELLDAQGRLVLQASQLALAGINEWTLNIDDKLPAGLYLCRVRTADAVAATSLLKQ